MPRGNHTQEGEHMNPITLQNLSSCDRALVHAALNAGLAFGILLKKSETSTDEYIILALGTSTIWDAYPRESYVKVSLRSLLPKGENE